MPHHIEHHRERQQYPGGPVFFVQVSNLAVPVPLDSGGLRVLSIERWVEGRIIICFEGAMNRYHEVQRSSDRVNWTTIQTTPVLSSPSIAAFYPAGDPDGEFHRIVLP